ncbi:hypothetical protein Tco_1527737, partial [Tanacetum coccineum]
MPLGYKAAMDRWRGASPSTCHPLLPSEIPSLSSPPSLLTSSSSPPPSLLPSLSCKRSRSSSLSLQSSVSPSPPPTAVPPPPESIKLIRDVIETMRASLASAMQETMTLHARVGSMEQNDVEVRELREFWVTDRLEILELHSRAEYVESHFEQSHNRHIRDRARIRRTDMTEQDIKASRARSEAIEQRVEILKVSLRAARMDVRDLIESREADRIEMVVLRSQAQ